MKNIFRTDQGHSDGQGGPGARGEGNGCAKLRCVPTGVIGMGLLGGAIAQRLLDLGVQVVGWDISADRQAAMLTAGVNVVPGARDVMVACDQVVLSLPTSDVVVSVIDEVMPVFHTNHYLIDTTTGEPDIMADMAARLETIGVHYLDATVSGSSSQARKGDIIMLVGGEPSAFNECHDLLMALAKQVHYAGSPGSGAKLKLVHNLVLGLNRAVLAEGLAFARSMGLDLSKTLEVLRSTIAYSQVMDTKGERMVSGNFEPEARVSQHLKDVRLILDSGVSVGARLPLCKTHRDLLETLEAAGWGTLDNSAIIRAFESLPLTAEAGVG